MLPHPTSPLWSTAAGPVCTGRTPHGARLWSLKQGWVTQVTSTAPRSAASAKGGWGENFDLLAAGRVVNSRTLNFPIYFQPFMSSLGEGAWSAPPCRSTHPPSLTPSEGGARDVPRYGDARDEAVLCRPPLPDIRRTAGGLAPPSAVVETTILNTSYILPLKRMCTYT